MPTDRPDKFKGVFLVSDYDDTLYGTSLHISQENRRAIRSFIARGGLFTVATGRARKTFSPQVTLEDIPLNAPAILSNGATIFDYATNQLVRRTYLPEQVLKDMEGVCRRFPQLGFEAYYQNEIYIHNPNIVTRRHLERVGMEGLPSPIPQIPLPLTKMILMHPRKDYLLQVQAYMRQVVGQGYEIIFSNDFLLELTARGSHKGGSVLWLAERLGIRPENLYCVGDNQNDLPMLQAARIGFAPENCSQELRDWGARIVNHCDRHCVAQVIEILSSMY